MSIHHLAALFTLLTTINMAAAEPPRLVVQLVVGSMQAGDMERYKDGIGTDGLGEFLNCGFHFTNSHFDFQQTTTPTTLATIATGAQPSSHGVIGEQWYDYIINDRVSLIEDTKVRNVEYSLDDYGYSPKRLIAPTLTQSLTSANEGARTVTIATNPLPAIVLNGKGGNCFWLDESSCSWSSSTAYFAELPSWVKKYNTSGVINNYLDTPWARLYDAHRYISEQPEPSNSKGKKQPKHYFEDNIIISDIGYNHQEKMRRYYHRASQCPTGNRLTLEFAKEAMAKLNLGADENTDLMNIYFDPAGYITEKYGPGSIEVEDMLYQIDLELADFMQYVRAQVEGDRVLFVLTSDHGSCPALTLEENKEFNTEQFSVILNSYLKARYGEGEWVLGMASGGIYLNHDTIYDRDLDLATVQDQVANFAIEFRGISHAITASALRNSYFGRGHGAMMQNSYYQRRSGDVLINFMPGWIERSGNDCVSRAGSLYRYDTHVPLIFLGAGVEAGTSHERISMAALAPTIAHLCQSRAPAASEAERLQQVKITKTK